MEIRKHPRTNHNFGAPADMQDGSCATLPVILHTDEHGTWAQSFFRLTAQELELINAGHSVVLEIRVGGGAPGEPVGHPVVALGVTAETTEPT